MVAALAATAPLATLATDCPPTVLTTVASCVPLTSPTKLPLKFVAVVAVVALVAEVAEVAEVAVVALPLKFAVIVPALKFPDASRFTMVFTVFSLVAASKIVLSAEDINPAFETVAFECNKPPSRLPCA